MKITLDKYKNNLLIFAREVLGMDFSSGSPHYLSILDKLNDKFGMNKWYIMYGRKGNPRIIGRN